MYSHHTELNHRDLDIRKSEDPESTEAESFSSEDEDPE